jgi:hypothetical protein
MNNRVEDVREASPRGIRFEIMLGSVLLAFGLFGLPALVYFVGAILLGPYLETASTDSIALFYRNFFADLAALSVRAWLIAIGPLLVIALFRLAFIGYRSADAERPARDVPPPRRPAPAARPAPPRSSSKAPAGRGSRRVEPRIGGD